MQIDLCCRCDESAQAGDKRVILLTRHLQSNEMLRFTVCNKLYLKLPVESHRWLKPNESRALSVNLSLPQA